MSEEANDDQFQARTRANIQQAVQVLQQTLQPYLRTFSAEELTMLRKVATTPGPRALPLPAANTDLGRLHGRLTQLRGQMAPFAWLDDLRAELEDLLVLLEGTLIWYGAERHDLTPDLQQALRLIMAN
ncbi:hypothetical protein [Hymenobacter jeollabukensis]|uniref:Uncharacterized protein n=1 Tax=Hymenobacter jeollabukensis TaxID=2025313 RepID=A0A5R8WM83_9BACT|nr:hypothetical protein [Hymenobacter jeollabukensis]TLM90525.1 hypothetical protein FDY95_17575 [Hymenobacter jeollabukensis]